MKQVLIFFMLFVAVAPATAAEVHLSFAASLKETVNELCVVYSRKNGTIVHQNGGASGTLARQIENGAPADIFISADTAWMDYLNSKQLMAPATIATFAGNELVFAGRSDSRIRSMADIVLLEKIGIGNPKSVPAGDYAMAAIRAVGREKDLAKRLIPAKDVRECLLYLERGEVDGGFIYLTDALLAKRAKILFTVPQHLYPKVEYQMGLTVVGSRNPQAVSLYNFLRGAEARAVLLKRGFKIR
jgi:molybdate transport system substrate-binding protein